MNNELFGSFIPDVYFSKITLETSAGSAFVSLAPVDSGVSLVKQRIDKNKVASIASAFDKNSLDKDEAPSFCKITLDLVAKDTLKKDYILNWMEQNNFTKFLKFVVVQLENKETIDFVEKNGILALEKINPDERHKYRFSKKILKVPQDVVGGGDAVKQQEDVFNDKGEKIINIPFRTSFLIQKDPQDLCYFSYSFIDINEISREFGFSNENVGDNLFYGNLIRENVISLGLLNNQSYVFLDKDNNPWFGPVFERGGKFYQEQQFINELKRFSFENNKIQDFRKVSRIDRLLLDFSIANNLRLNSKLDKTFSQKIIVKEGKSYFSNLCLSQDQDGNIRFFFGFDARRFLQDNSLYGKLFLNGKQFEEAVRRSFIQSIKIYRKRIAGSAEAGSEPRREYLFDENQPPYVIVESKDVLGNFNTLTTINNKKSSLKEIPSLFVEDPNSVGIRYFTGADKTVKNNTDGYYQYSAELSFMDGSVVVLANKLNQLKQSKAQLNSYYVLSSKPENFDVNLNRFTNAFYSKMRVKYGLGNDNAPWFKAVDDYLDFINITSELNRIEEEELRKQLYIYNHPRTGNPNGIQTTISLIDNLINKLEKALKLFNQATNLGYIPNGDVKESSVYFKQSNNSKNLTTEKTFFEIVNTSKLTKDGYEVLDVDTPDDVSGLKLITGQDYNRRVEREIDVLFERKDGIKPNINLEVGGERYTENDSIDTTSYSYLGFSYALERGIKSLSRVGNSPGPSQPSDSFVNFSVSSKKSNNSLNVSKNNTPIGVPEGTSLSREQIFTTTNIEKFSAELGLNVIKEVVRAPSIVGRPNLPRFTAVRDSSPVDELVHEEVYCFNRQSFDDAFDASPVLLNLVEKISPSPNNRFRVGNSAGNSVFADKRERIRTTDIKMYDLTNKINYVKELVANPENVKSELFFRGRPHNTTLNDALRQLPNHTKAMFLSYTKPEVVKTNWSKELGQNGNQIPGQKTKFDLFQNFLQTIEVFTGFKTDEKTKEPLIKEESWMPLTLEMYNKIFSKTLLCRMRTYKNEFVGVIPEETLEKPIFHQYFLVLSQPRPQLTLPPPITLIRPEVLPSRPSLTGLLNTAGITPETTSSTGVGPSAGVGTGAPRLNQAPPPGELVFEPEGVATGEQQRCSNLLNDALLDTIPIEQTTTNAGGIYENSSLQGGTRTLNLIGS